MIAKIIKTKTKKLPFHPSVKFIIFKCNWCKNPFEKMGSYYKKQKKRVKNACCFCSRSCKSKWIASIKFQKGKKHPKWQGGIRINSNGYRMIYFPEHPHNIKNYVYEHRLIMEKRLGRILKKDEHIHHKNGNTLDNRTENLQIFSNSKHAQFHKMFRHIK